MVSSKVHSISQPKENSKKLHWCMDGNRTKSGYNFRERLSSTKQVHLGKMASRGLHWSQPSSSRNHSDLENSMLGIDKNLHGCCDSTTPNLVFNVNIQIPIGPLFQVEVPEWTGVALESDTKWLETRIWPLEKMKNEFLIERDRIGKGRQESCGCHIRDFIQCVKFHGTKKRLKVKLELGLAFYQWKFDKMGKAVALCWKEEEMKMFSSIVKSNPPSLWDEICQYFQNKSKEELVCYYFNVYILQQRAYKNRIHPKNISWDDEEIEDGTKSINKGTKRKATKSYTSILIPSKKSQKKSRYSSSSRYEKAKMLSKRFKNESFTDKDFVLCSNIRRKNNFFRLQYPTVFVNFMHNNYSVNFDFKSS